MRVIQTAKHMPNLIIWIVVKVIKILVLGYVIQQTRTIFNAK